MMLILVPQFDNSPLANKNCFAAEGALLVAMETANQRTPTAAEFRSNVYNLGPNGQPTTKDVTGGGRPTQIVETAKRAYGVVLDYRLMPFEDAWKLGQRDDVALGFSISYAPVAPTQYDGSPGFTGLHGVTMSGGLIYDPLADGRKPGIPNGPQAWPKSLLMLAAGKYAGTGVGRAAVIVARAPAVKPGKFSVVITPGAIWKYPLDGTTKRFRDEFPKRTSAPCTAPFTIPWQGGRKRVVEVTEGRLAGWGVEPGATHLALREGKAA